MCISSTTLGELVNGAEKSTAPEHNLADIESMISRLQVKPFDSQAAIHFGQIRAALAKIGKPIGPYDAMITGHAHTLALVLVTNNENEFQRMPGLMRENWV